MTPPTARLLAGLVIAMSVSAAVLIVTIPPHFSPGGGSAVMTALFAGLFAVFAVAALIVRSAKPE